MKIKIIVILLFTLALKFNVIAAERVENEKKTAESVFAVAKADVLKSEMKDLSMSESAKPVKMAVKDAKALSSTGTVKFFNYKKGVGFIKEDGSGADILVYIHAVKEAGLEGSLKAGDRVSFDVENDRKGNVHAVHLSMLDE